MVERPVERAPVFTGTEAAECPHCGRTCFVTSIALPIPPAIELRTIVCRDGAYLVGLGRKRFSARPILDRALIDSSVSATREALHSRRRGTRRIATW
jgi:hypothetical protein